jgi:hypothetical protein
VHTQRDTRDTSETPYAHAHADSFPLFATLPVEIWPNILGRRFNPVNAICAAGREARRAVLLHGATPLTLRIPQGSDEDVVASAKRSLEWVHRETTVAPPALKLGLGIEFQEPHSKECPSYTALINLFMPSIPFKHITRIDMRLDNSPAQTIIELIATSCPNLEKLKCSDDYERREYEVILLKRLTCLRECRWYVENTIQLRVEDNTKLQSLECGWNTWIGGRLPSTLRELNCSCTDATSALLEQLETLPLLDTLVIQFGASSPRTWAPKAIERVRHLGVSMGDDEVTLDALDLKALTSLTKLRLCDGEHGWCAGAIRMIDLSGCTRLSKMWGLSANLNDSVLLPTGLHLTHLDIWVNCEMLTPQPASVDELRLFDCPGGLVIVSPGTRKLDIWGSVSTPLTLTQCAVQRLNVTGCFEKIDLSACHSLASLSLSAELHPQLVMPPSKCEINWR